MEVGHRYSAQKQQLEIHVANNRLDHTRISAAAQKQKQGFPRNCYLELFKTLRNSSP